MPTVANTPGNLRFSSNEAESYLAALDDCAAVGIAAVAGPELRFTAANAAFAAMARSPNAPITGRTVAQLFPHLSAEALLALRGVLATGTPRRLAAAEIAVGPAGERRWWNLEYVRLHEDAPHGVLMVTQDVTAHVLRRRELEANEARFRATFSQAAVGIAHLDLDGHWLEVNDRLCELLGHSRSELLARTFLDVTHPDDAEADVAELHRLRAGEIESYSLSKRYVRGDGSVFWGRLTCSLVRDGRDRPQHFITIVQDVSRARAAREERDRLLAELQAERERLTAVIADARAAREQAEAESNAKSRFLSTLSHEVRTPLTAVIGLAELMGRGIAGPVTERQAEYVSRIQGSAWHLVGIIDEILTYSRSEAGRDDLNLATADVAHVVREVAQMFAGQAEAQGLRVEVRGAQDEVLATVDAGKLRQVLINLVGNAFKYTESGSVRISLAAAADVLEFSVRDTGCGIAPARIADIFEPFVQVRAADAPGAGGAGLGLTICRRLARLMGGDVSVESIEGRGSTFTLALPRAS